LFGRFFLAVLGYLILFLLIQGFSFKQFRTLFKQPIDWIIALLITLGTLYPLFVGSNLVMPGLVLLLWSIYPLLSILSGRLIFKDKFSVYEWMGIVIMSVLSFVLAFARYPFGGELVGIFWILLSIGAYLTGLILSRIFISERLVEEVSFLGSILSLGIMFFVVLPGLNLSAVLSLIIDWRVIYMGLIMTILAGYLFIKSTYYLHFSEVMVFIYMQAIVSVLAEVFVFKNPISVLESLLLTGIATGFIIMIYAVRREYTKKTSKKL